MSRITFNQWLNMLDEDQKLPDRFEERIIIEAFRELSDKDRKLWVGFFLYYADKGRLFSKDDMEAEGAEIKQRLSLIKTTL